MGAGGGRDRGARWWWFDVAAVPSLSHMRRSRPVPLRRMKLVHGSRSGRLRSKLLEYQSRSLPHRSQVRKVHLFRHCSPKNFTACNFVATKRDPTAYKKHCRDFSALCSRYSPGTRTLQGSLVQGTRALIVE